MEFLEKWIEYDYNPWILFDSNGRVKTLNQEAQFLLAEATVKEIFDLAVAYANISYGFKTTMLDLNYGRYEFFGIMVGYEDNDTIAIRLYQKPPERISNPHIDNMSSHNIYTLIDLAVSTSSISRHHGFTTSFDPTFPEMKIHPEEFVKLMTEIFLCFNDSEPIEIKMTLKTGETLKFEKKRYPIFQVAVKGDLDESCRTKALSELARKLNGYIVKKENRILFEAPLIAG
ncbi:hypothetical protein [Hydrogenimonas sp.]